MTDPQKEARRARGRQLQAEFAERGDPFGWFEAFYREAEGDNTQVSWADLEPNRFFSAWAEENGLKGDERRALVVGCGLGDDARYLADLGFRVTAFDISPTAIEWARRLHAGSGIQFEVANLFEPFRGWLGAFDFVLEIYTIQPLPLELRPKVIDAIAAFVAPGGHLIVVCRGREDDEEPTQMPWPLSRRDLSRFLENGLTQVELNEVWDTAEDQIKFVVDYCYST